MTSVPESRSIARRIRNQRNAVYVCSTHEDRCRFRFIRCVTINASARALKKSRLSNIDSIGNSLAPLGNLCRGIQGGVSHVCGNAGNCSGMTMSQARTDKPRIAPSVLGGVSAPTERCKRENFKYSRMKKSAEPPASQTTRTIRDKVRVKNGRRLAIPIQCGTRGRWPTFAAFICERARNISSIATSFRVAAK